MCPACYATLMWTWTIAAGAVSAGGATAFAVTKKVRRNRRVAKSMNKENQA